MMKKYAAIICVIVMFAVSAIGTELNVSSKNISKTDENNIPDELENLYAQSAVLMDADNGRILFGKNEEKIMPMASTTKIMTCILILENADIRDKAKVSSNAAAQPRVKLGANEGEEYYIEDLLYSLMLESHNDSAVILAEYLSGNVERFALLMNKKAEEIGCQDTYFITPNGLDAFDEKGKHSTTAKDLALIMRYCIEVSDMKEMFLKITQTREYTFTDVSGNRSLKCINHNAFLDMMEGALSGKTGFTADAGYCYVGALKQENEKYIVALLACGWPNNKNYKWSDAKKLMKYGVEKYSYKHVFAERRIDDIIVEDGMPENWENAIKIRLVKDDISRLDVLIKEGEKVTIKVDTPKKVTAPIKAGMKAGEIKYYISSSIIGKTDLYFSENIDKKTLWRYLVKITKEMLIL